METCLFLSDKTRRHGYCGGIMGCRLSLGGGSQGLVMWLFGWSRLSQHRPRWSDFILRFAMYDLVPVTPHDLTPVFLWFSNVLNRLSGHNELYPCLLVLKCVGLIMWPASSGVSRPPYASSSSHQSLPSQRNQVGAVSHAHPARPSASPTSTLKLATVAVHVDEVSKVSTTR